MFCSQCGVELPEGKRFCVACGNPVSQARGGTEESQATVSAEESERLAQLERKQAEALRADRERVLESYEVSRDPEMTPVAQVLGDGRIAYDVLPGDNEDIPEKDAKVELKEAKAAYKNARKAAGKSAAPKVIAIIIAIIAVAGAGAGVMWWFSGQQASLMSSQSSSSAYPASPSTPKDASSSLSSKSAQGGIESYEGVWKGSLVEATKYAFVGCCYGAEKYPLVLNVKKVSNTGSVTADAEVLFHEHEDLNVSDAASTDGDVYIELKDLVGSLSADGEFTFKEGLDKRGEYEEVMISVKTIDMPDGSRTLEVIVDSQVIGGHATDLYTLRKE